MHCLYLFVQLQNFMLPMWKFTISTLYSLSLLQNFTLVALRNTEKVETSTSILTWPFASWNRCGCDSKVKYVLCKGGQNVRLKQHHDHQSREK